MLNTLYFCVPSLLTKLALCFIINYISIIEGDHKLESKKVKKQLDIRILTRAAMISAIIFVMTRFPMIGPIGTGYVHLGDGAVMLAAALLPQPYAIIAAVIGASLADLTAGYFIYIPMTAIIKGAMTLLFSSKSEKLVSLRNITALAVSIVINALGYYIGEAIISKSFAVPLSSIPFNLLQGIVGAIIFVVLAIIIDANTHIRKIVRGK